MKKIFSILMSLAALSSVSAQQSNKHYPQQRDETNVAYQDRSDDQSGYDRNHTTVGYGRERSQQNNKGYTNRQRREQMGRINHEYDRRIKEYRNDRSFNTYERNRSLQAAEKERNGKLKSFGGGLILGGILGVLLGTQL